MNTNIDHSTTNSNTQTTYLPTTTTKGIILTGFVLACELFAPKHRTFACTMIENFWAIAWSVFPLIAYLFSNWVHLQLFISLFGLLTVPLYWWFIRQSLQSFNSFLIILFWYNVCSYIYFLNFSFEIILWIKLNLERGFQLINLISITNIYIIPNVLPYIYQ